MKKAITVLGVTLLVGVGSLTSVHTYANATGQIESKILENQQKQSEVNSQITKLMQAIEENQKVLTNTEEEIKNSQSELDQLKSEKEAIEKTMAEREELIKNRLRVMQSGGGTMGYLEVLLGSTDFEDFISRFSAIATLTKADQDLIAEQEKDAQALEEKENVIQKDLTELQNQKLELEGMKANISDQKAQAEALKQQLSAEEQQLLADKLAEEKAAQEAKAKAEQESIQNVESQSSNSSSTNNTANSNQTTINSSNDRKTSNSVATQKSEKKATVSTASSKPTASGSSAINIVTSVGNRFIGNSSYVWGAADPANGHFDCSGFINWAFAQAGISVGRSTSALQNEGTRVSASQMRPGDLVFFNTYKTNGHVGIYLGGGKFIGSQGKSGVAIASMTSGYFKDTFAGYVVRIIK